MLAAAIPIDLKKWKKKMFGQVSYDVEVDVSASNAWKLYGTLLLAMVMEEGPSPPLEKFELIEGDGGVGTVIKLIFAPGKGII